MARTNCPRTSAPLTLDLLSCHSAATAQGTRTLDSLPVALFPQKSEHIRTYPNISEYIRALRPDRPLVAPTRRVEAQRRRLPLSDGSRSLYVLHVHRPTTTMTTLDCNALLVLCALMALMALCASKGHAIC